MSGPGRGCGGRSPGGPQRGGHRENRATMTIGPPSSRGRLVSRLTAGAVVLVAVGVGSSALASDATSDPLTFTGCLGRIGVIYNVSTNPVETLRARAGRRRDQRGHWQGWNAGRQAAQGPHERRSGWGHRREPERAAPRSVAARSASPAAAARCSRWASPATSSCTSGWSAAERPYEPPGGRCGALGAAQFPDVTSPPAGLILRPDGYGCEHDRDP